MTDTVQGDFRRILGTKIILHGNCHSSAPIKARKVEGLGLVTAVYLVAASCPLSSSSTGMIAVESLLWGS